MPDLSAYLHLPPASKREALRLLDLRRKRKAGETWRTYFPDAGPQRRELYGKHLAFFAAGREHRQRCFMAGNRVGKTIAGGYEAVCHLTGVYPDWWVGRRFDRPVMMLAAGDTGQTTRDIIQHKLLGGVYGTEDFGTGLLPRAALDKKPMPKSGIPNAYEEVPVRHISGGYSTLRLRSYDQGRRIFQGIEVDVVWVDEECPLDVYTECLVRTMTTGGMTILTYTPLLGLSDITLQFLPGGKLPETGIAEDGGRYLVMAGWDDAPHLTEEDKSELLRNIPPFQRDARSKGVPQLGAGAIYPVPESDFVVKDFEIPKHFPRAYGLDVGWNRTAAVWGAIDRETDTLYVYSEHYRGQAEPAVHAQAIRARGDWVPGVIDPAARGRAQADGEQLFQKYIDLGLSLSPAKNAREAGIYEVWSRLSSGRLKVFGSLQNLLAEFRIYRRDERGNVVKENDHALDALRYLVMSGIDLAITEPVSSGRRRGGNWRTA